MFAAREGQSQQEFGEQAAAAALPVHSASAEAWCCEAESALAGSGSAAGVCDHIPPVSLPWDFSHGSESASCSSSASPCSSPGRSGQLQSSPDWQLPGGSTGPALPQSMPDWEALAANAQQRRRETAAVSLAVWAAAPAQSCQLSGAVSLRAVSGASAAPLMGAEGTMQLDVSTLLQAPPSLEVAVAIKAL